MKKKLVITGYRTVSWFKRTTREILWGVDVKLNGRWYHYMDGDEPTYFKTEHEASQLIKKIYFDTPAN